MTAHTHHTQKAAIPKVLRQLGSDVLAFAAWYSTGWGPISSTTSCSPSSSLAFCSADAKCTGQRSQRCQWSPGSSSRRVPVTALMNGTEARPPSGRDMGSSQA